ncbi:DUF3626 domain-containing protein [Isoptericola variabilis]|uniref:DUF3626 domain-containing protein n=1 Tax=Isoptericola variabilis TaxID=139208 RepID=UPI0002D4E14F|nr:DUF3626 domain-containing protein [Isoptericola variabilis]TWH30697.1 uncharacterized protein DUF3626 [Isoptericola variabilis J7]
MSLTLHFRPDWPFAGGLVIEAMARDGRYRSQFETGTSNGGLTAPRVGVPAPGAARARPDVVLLPGQRVRADVEAVVLDPCHADSPVAHAAARLGCAVEHHPGYRVVTADLDAGFRGPEPVVLARSLGTVLTPGVVAAAARSGEHDPQTVKYVWHLLARFGRGWSAVVKANPER